MCPLAFEVPNWRLLFKEIQKTETILPCSSLGDNAGPGVLVEHSDCYSTILEKGKDDGNEVFCEKRRKMHVGGGGAFEERSDLWSIKSWWIVAFCVLIGCHELVTRNTHLFHWGVLVS